MGPSPSSERTRGVTVQDSGDVGSKSKGWRLKVQGMTFQSPGDDGSKSRGWQFRYGPVNCVHPDRLSGSHLWRMTRVILPLDIVSDRSVASSSVHFLYKYHTPPFSFPIFCWNILSERIRHTCQRPLRSVVVSVINAFCPFTNYFGKYSLFHIFFSFIYTFIFLDFIPLSPLLDSSES